MRYNSIKKITAMLTAFVFTLSLCVSVPFNTILAADEYNTAEIITSKIAGADGVYEDSAATNGNFSTTGDVTTKKRVQMSGIKSGQSDEAAATYYALLNPDNNYARDNGWLRLSAGNSSNNVLNFKGNLVQIDGSSFSGYKFYSNSSDLYARFSIVDQNAKSGANYTTDSSKGIASTMTYEFDLKFTENFFDILAYVSTRFAGSDSGRDINALKIDSNGSVWATASNFSGSNAEEIATLELGEKYTFGIVVSLSEAGDANKYNYKIDVYIDGENKFTADGANSVTAGNTKFYGFEMDFRPWTVDKEFDYTQNSGLGESTQYAETGSGTTKAKYLSAAVTNEYSIIDTVTTVSDFYVYAGDMYSNVARTYKSLSFADLSEEDSNNITKDLTLPTDGTDGAIIEWESSNEDIVATDGRVNTEAMENEAEDIILTAVIKNEDESIIIRKEFNITVIKEIKESTDVTEVDGTLFTDTFADGTSKINTQKSSKLWPLGTKDTASGVNTAKDMKFGVDGTANFWLADGWAIYPIKVGAVPELVYSLDKSIKSFSIDTFYCSRNGAWPTEFSFEVSHDGEEWISVPKADVTVEKASVASPGGYYPWKFTVKDVKGSRYSHLKIIFGDNAQTLQNFTISLDTVTVNLWTNVEATYNSLDFDMLSDEDIETVTKNLTLPTSGIGDATITWESSDEAVLSENGVINTDAFDGYRKEIELKATIENEDGSEKAEKSFTVSIVKDISSFEDSEIIAYDLSALSFKSITDQPQHMLAESITLPKGVSIGSTFTWSVTESNAATIIGNKLYLFPQNEAQTTLELTVTATYGEASDSKTFEITVVRGFGENLLYYANMNATSGDIEKALSRDVVTYWESSNNDGEKTVTAVFEEEQSINSALIVEKGDNISAVEIKTSANGINYETVYSGKSNGDLVRKPVWFMPVNCKYVQFVFDSEDAIKVATLELYNTTICDEQLIDYSLEELVLPEKTSENITLPTEGSYFGNISWTTEDDKIITENGVITRDKYQNKTTKLTATITNGIDVTKSKEFYVTVLGTDVPKEPKSDISFDFVDNFTDYSKIYASSTQYTASTPEQPGDDTPLRLNNQPTTSVPTKDGWFLQPMRPGYQPWLVYKFEDPIYGFKADTLYTKRGNGGVFPTDFTFFLSPDGKNWTQVPEEKITATRVTDIHTAGYYPWTFEAKDLPEGNYYLKLVFGDSSGQGSSAAGFSITIDTLTVSHLTSVSQAYNEIEFSDLSSEPVYAVTKNLTLPLTGIKNTSVKWSSSNPAVLSDTGVINTDEFIGYSIDVDLTAKIEVKNSQNLVKDGEAQEKTYTVTVCRDVENWSDEDFVNYDLTHLFHESFTNQPKEHIATDIHFPTGFVGGCDFTWNIKSGSGAKLNGYVATFTPQYTQISPVVFTVTAKHGNATGTKDFPMDVVRAFAENLMLKGKVNASSDGIRKALSRDVVTYWESAAADKKKVIDVEFSKEVTINSGLLVEVGNNITGFKLEVSDNGNTWEEVYSGTSNGNLVRSAYAFDSVSCKFARITISSENPVKIATVELYNSIVTEQQAFELSLDSLNIPTSTSKDIDLPTKGEHIGTITWTTSDDSVITAEGKVSRALNKSKSVTLTATLTYNGMTKTKSFNVTVNGKVQAGGSSGGGGGGGSRSGGVVASKDLSAQVQNNQSGPVSFADVSESHWAYDYITELTKNGIISKADTFRPSDMVTREEFVKLIVAATGGIKGEAQSTGFSDTDNTAWYYPYITAAHDKGIVTGNIDGSFGVGASITRQDAAAMLYRAIENKNIHDEIMTFTDGSIVSVYAAEAITYLANEGILNGYEDGSFRPFNNLTRAESAKIIYMLSTLAKED